MNSGIGTGRIVARAQYTCTKCPSAEAIAASPLNTPHAYRTELRPKVSTAIPTVTSSGYATSEKNRHPVSATIPTNGLVFVQNIVLGGIRLRNRLDFIQCINENPDLFLGTPSPNFIVGAYNTGGQTANYSGGVDNTPMIRFREGFGTRPGRGGPGCRDVPAHRPHP